MKEKFPGGGKIEFAKKSEFIKQVSGVTINSCAYSLSNTHAKPKSSEEYTVSAPQNYYTMEDIINTNNHIKQFFHSLINQTFECNSSCSLTIMYIRISFFS